MKHFYTIISLLIFSSASSQSICGTANENGTVVLTAPAGRVFTSVTFASYGSPGGSCGSFTMGACHAVNSQAIVEAALIGNNSASIPATNAVFGDPCNGTVKQLYIEAVYSFALPLKLNSFTGSSFNNANILNWETAEEMNTASFEVERSIDGTEFIKIGSINSVNTPGMHKYSFTDNNLQHHNYLYRLKMNDLDGKFVYSNIIKIQNARSINIETSPNPVTDLLTIRNLSEPGLLELISSQGNLLAAIKVSSATAVIDLSNYPKGIYIIRFQGSTKTSITKILKN